MNQRSFGGLPALGSAYEGGFFAGQIGVSGVATHNLVIGPLSTAQTMAQWKTSNSDTSGTTSVINGPANTAAMIAAGAAAHPCGQFCDNLVVGGFSDWYMPAQNELEICYFNFRPTDTGNNPSSGVNPNAVPPRASPYTEAVPPVCTIPGFTAGASEAFANSFYWASTQPSTNAGLGWTQNFNGGNQAAFTKTYSLRVRAVRRVPV